MIILIISIIHFFTIIFTAISLNYNRLNSYILKIVYNLYILIILIQIYIQ